MNTPRLRFALKNAMTVKLTAFAVAGHQDTSARPQATGDRCQKRVRRIAVGELGLGIALIPERRRRYGGCRHEVLGSQNSVGRDRFRLSVIAATA
jgi:hypothetical protein